MATYVSSEIGVAIAGPNKLPSVGVTYTVELKDGSERTVLILHYESEESAEACATALADLAFGLVAITDPSI